MPQLLADVARNLDLPLGVSYEIAYHLDGIRLWKGGKEIGMITRAQIDDSLTQQRLKEILDDRDRQ